MTGAGERLGKTFLLGNGERTFFRPPTDGEILTHSETKRMFAVPNFAPQFNARVAAPQAFNGALDTLISEPNRYSKH